MLRHSTPTAGFVPWAAVSVHLVSIQQTQRGSFHAADESESPASASRQPGAQQYTELTCPRGTLERAVFLLLMTTTFEVKAHTKTLDR